MEKYDGYHLMKYGSSINGLCSKLTSDLDLTIITEFQWPEIVLKDVVCVLGKYGEKRYEVTTPPRKDKAGWILKFRDTLLETDIDLMINKNSEVLNSLLLLQYSQLDERFMKVTYFLK
jgi:DNA polymerase sigma